MCKLLVFLELGWRHLIFVIRRSWCSYCRFPKLPTDISKSLDGHFSVLQWDCWLIACLWHSCSKCNTGVSRLCFRRSVFSLFRLRVHCPYWSGRISQPFSITTGRISQFLLLLLHCLLKKSFSNWICFLQHTLLTPDLYCRYLFM